ncbi:6-bladed beta-propeller protein [Rhizobiales bacterium GAS191]|jgi:DNA-binding beta-propeller fold protein YncE|nr:6-bladed beta-propeller protein [Rhizobiales bacterium GAS188]SEE67800.1 6-bladed beta-propeller protein [Rhizobiales bacterium GAS191]
MTGLVTTDGKRRYEVHRNWARLPKGMEFGPVSQLAVDGTGRVFVVQRAVPAVLVFAQDGAFEYDWHHPLLTNATGAGVHGVCVAPSGMLLITSFDSHQVLGFDGRGRLELELGRFNEPRWGEPFNHPTDVAVAANGDIFVTDGYGNARVHRFSSKGEFIAGWGEPGTGPGQFSCPHGIWISVEGKVIVLDRDNNRVQLFDVDGKLLDIWSSFVKPMDIWGDASGDLFISDQTPRIARVADGRIKGAMRGFTVYPHGIWGDSSGSLYVAEQQPSGVAKYTALAPDDRAPAK